MIEKELVFYNKNFSSRNELLDFISDVLYEKGYVYEGYKEGIKEREEKYPTGLMLNGINIAICHAELQYAKENKMFVIKLENPVEFKNAENFNGLEVELVIGLVLSDGEKHLKNLQKLAKLLLDNDVIKTIKSIDNQDELYDFFKLYFDLKEV